MKPFQLRYWYWMIPLLWVATGLGARELATDLLFVDEYWSIRNSGGLYGPLGPSGIWERTATEDPGGMGIFYHFLLAGWQRLVGITPFSIRAFSLLLATITLALLFHLGRHLSSPAHGLYAATLLTGSAVFIDYAHEGRAYTLITALCVIAVLAYHRLLMRPQAHPVWYVVLALSLAAVAYTHYVVLALGAALGVMHLTQFRPTRHWWRIVAAMALGGLLFLPWVGITLQVVQRGVADMTRQADSMTALRILEQTAISFSSANWMLLLLLGFFALQQRTRSLLLVIIWAGVGLGLVLLVNAFIPFAVHIRYVLFVFPALALIGAIGLHNLNHNGFSARPILIIWLLVGVGQALAGNLVQDLFGQVYRPPADGFERALNVLDARASAEDLALVHIMPPGDEPKALFVLDYYFRDLDLRVEQYELLNLSQEPSDNAYLEDVWIGLGEAPVVWSLIVPQVPTTNKTGVVEYALRTQYVPCGVVQDHEHLHMTAHARHPMGEPLARFTAPDDATIQLVVHDLGRMAVRDQHIEGLLGWTSDTIPPGTYSVGLHVLNEAGVLVAQQDFGLPDLRPVACSNTALDLSSVAPGSYRLHLVVYAWQTGERLRASGPDDAMQRSIPWKQIEIGAGITVRDVRSNNGA